MRYLLILFVILLSACTTSTVHDFTVPAPDVAGPTGSPGIDGKSCAVASTATGATITCTDNSSATITNGLSGEVGSSGADGSSCSVKEVDTGAVVSCSDGFSANINNGLPGDSGLPGEAGTSCSVLQGEGSVTLLCDDETSATVSDGLPGLAGSSCSVQSTSFGSVVSCSDGSSASITNGLNGVGEVGPQGVPGTSCTVSAVTGGANLTCSNGTVFISNGAPGQSSSSDTWSLYNLPNNTCVSIGSGLSVKSSSGCQVKLYKSSSSCSGSYDAFNYFYMLSSTTKLEVDTVNCELLKTVKGN